MDKNDYAIGARVKLHTDDAWNELYGIIDEFIGDTIAVYCITKPLYRYYVGIDEIGNVLELLRQ